MRKLFIAATILSLTVLGNSYNSQAISACTERNNQCTGTCKPYVGTNPTTGERIEYDQYCLFIGGTCTCAVPCTTDASILSFQCNDKGCPTKNELCLNPDGGAVGTTNCTCQVPEGPDQVEPSQETE